eukprot:scaffold39883_cov36-Tisochrysis_lutea.AAC.4
MGIAAGIGLTLPVTSTTHARATSRADAERQLRFRYRRSFMVARELPLDEVVQLPALAGLRGDVPLHECVQKIGLDV